VRLGGGGQGRLKEILLGALLMSLCLVTLRYTNALGGLDDAPLRKATQDRDVLKVESFFFTVDGLPHLSLLMRLGPASMASKDTQDVPSSKRKRSFLEQLEGPERTRAESLRTWRSEKAKREGIPPFVILTNKQLVAIAELNPTSPSALKAIDGFGEKSLARHGDEIIATLTGTVETSGPTNAEQDNG
jgi:superfamily II DNA helicase RecQ